MKQKRLTALLLSLLLVLFAPVSLAARVPEPDVYSPRTAVSDEAVVLSSDTVNDVLTLNGRTNVSFYVTTKHFLGGAQAQAYCDRLFEEYVLGIDDVLLLLVIGEERYAVTMGDNVKRAISNEQMNNLLSSKLRQPFIEERDYDAAVGDFLLAAAAQVAKAQGTSLSVAGLFGNAGSIETARAQEQYDFDYWAGNWWNGFFGNGAEKVDEYFEDEYYDDGYYYDDYEYEYEYTDSGFSFGKLIILGIVLLFIISNRRKQGKKGMGVAGWYVASKAMDELNKMGNTKRVVRRTPSQRPGNFSRPRPPQRRKR